MVNEWVQYQKLNFQNGISQNNGKCKLGTFLLRLSYNQVATAILNLLAG